MGKLANWVPNSWYGELLVMGLLGLVKCGDCVILKNHCVERHIR